MDSPVRSDTERLDDVVKRATAPDSQGVTFYHSVLTGLWQYQERDKEGYLSTSGYGDTPREAIDAAIAEERKSQGFPGAI